MPDETILNLTAIGLMALCIMFLAIQHRSLSKSVKKQTKVIERTGKRNQGNREFAIQNQLGQISEDTILLVGDSLVEGGLVEGVVNAGVGGYTSKDAGALLFTISQNEPVFAKINTIIISVGMNDSVAGHSTAEFLSSIRSIVRAAEGKRLVITTIPIPASSTIADADLVKSYNSAIRTMDTPSNIAIFDLASGMDPENSNYRVNFLDDGLHLSPEGYSIWRAGIVKAISTLSGNN